MGFKPPRNRISGVFVGLALVSAVGFGCVSNYVQTLKHELSKSSRRDMDRIVAMVDENVIEDNKIEYVEKGDYLKLCFDSANEFVQSLQSIVRVEGADTFYQSSLYDADDKELIKVYETDTGNVSVAVSEDGTVECCKFKGISSDDTIKIRNNLEGTGYNYKVTGDGFILESSSVA